MMANEQGSNISNLTPTPTTTREYRKGNWTIQESMILIEAKKMDDERRMKRITTTSDDHHHHHQEIGVGSSSASGVLRSVISNKPTELRWKWVEDYCWKRGTFRSQNQCNDKWDNLMRDYKKIRDYQNNINAAAQNNLNNINVVSNNNGEVTEKGCYWNMEKFERKAKNLPSNMLHQIYDALVEVVEKKGVSSSSGIGIGGVVHNRVMQLGCSSGSGSGSGGGSGGPIMQPVTLCLPPQLQLPVQTPISSPTPIAPALPPVAPTPTPVMPLAFVPLPTQPICDDDSSSSESDASEYSEPAQGQAPTVARRESSSNKKKRSKGGDDDESEITKSATMIAQAIQACEEREEKRHKQILIMHEKRLKIEESKIVAINNLANSLLALAHNQTPPST